VVNLEKTRAESHSEWCEEFIALNLNTSGVGTVDLAMLQANGCKPGSGLHAILLFSAVESSAKAPRGEVQENAALQQAVLDTSTFGLWASDVGDLQCLKYLKRIRATLLKKGFRSNGTAYHSTAFLAKPWNGCHLVGDPGPPAALLASVAATSDVIMDTGAAATANCWYKAALPHVVSPWTRTAVRILDQLFTQLWLSEENAIGWFHDPRPALSAELFAIIKGFIPLNGWGAALADTRLAKRVGRPPSRFDPARNILLILHFPRFFVSGHFLTKQLPLLACAHSLAHTRAQRSNGDTPPRPSKRQTSTTQSNKRLKLANANLKLALDSEEIAGSEANTALAASKSEANDLATRIRRMEGTLNRERELRVDAERRAADAEAQRLAFASELKVAMRAHRRSTSTHVIDLKKLESKNDGALQSLQASNGNYRVKVFRMGKTIKQLQAAQIASHAQSVALAKVYRGAKHDHHCAMEEASVRYELAADVLHDELRAFELQLKNGSAVKFLKEGSTKMYNNFFFDTARRFLSLGLSPSMTHKVMCESMAVFGLEADKMGGERAIKKAKKELAVLLCSQVGERCDAAIEAGASIQLMQDATSLLHRDGASLMAVRLRIVYPEGSSKRPRTEVLTAGVKQTRSGNTEDEYNAIIQISEDIADMMVPPGTVAASQLDRRRFALAPQTRISDTAATAIKVNVKLGEERRKWVVTTKAYKAGNAAQRLKMLQSVDLDCVSHGVQNAGLSISKAMDAAAQAMVGYVLEGGQDFQLASCSEVANADQGWTRFLYEAWKFLLDGTYAHGTHNDFLSWLKKKDAALAEKCSDGGDAPFQLAKFALASGPIIGGRFLQTARVAMLLVPLWDAATEYMTHEYSPAARGETQTNKLAKEVLLFLNQTWRRPMIRAAAMGYGDILGPFLFQMRHSQTVLGVSDWWVKLEAELAMLQENPGDTHTVLFNTIFENTLRSFFN
jgi:hypothetical protein